MTAGLPDKVCNWTFVSTSIPRGMSESSLYGLRRGNDAATPELCLVPAPMGGASATSAHVGGTAVCQSSEFSPSESL